jgi:hypothetical protein
MFIQEIVKEWKKKTNGYIKLDDVDEYMGDYYLSINNENTYSSHIHFITKKTPCTQKQCRYCTSLCYVVKKNNLHSELYNINENKTPKQIVQEMLENYNSFTPSIHL